MEDPGSLCGWAKGAILVRTRAAKRLLPSPPARQVSAGHGFM